MNLIKSSQKKVSKATKTLSEAMSLKSYRKLVINFLILSVNLVIIILYFTLSKATILIIPKKEKITHQISIPIKETINDDEKDTAIQGRKIEIPLSLTKDFIVSETQENPAVAQGQITLYNKTNHSQKLVKTTQLKNQNNNIIRLSDNIDLAPGASVTIGAYADQPGKVGEVGAGRFQIVKLRDAVDKIYGEVTKPFTGGTVAVKILSQKDLDKAKIDVTADLKTLGLQKIKEQVADINENNLTVEIISLTPSAKIGDTNIDKFTVKAEGKASAFFFDAQAALDLIKNDLKNSTPPNKIITSINDSSFTGKVISTDNNISLDASIAAQTLPQLSDAVLDKKAIFGLNKNEVEAYFKKITGIDGIIVKFSPFWVRSVPNIEDHVEIEIKK